MNEQREKLELVVNQLALQIITKSGLRAKPEQFRIYLSHDMLATAVMKYGSPVQIYLKELDMVEALVKKGNYLNGFNATIESCLRNVPRLHPDTSIVVPAKIIKREEEKWLIHKGVEADLFPNLIPEEQISYKISLYVEGRDVTTNRLVRFMTKNLDIEKMRRDIRELLSAPPETKADAPEEITDD